MKAAGEEAGVQAPVAAVLRATATWRSRPGSPGRGAPAGGPGAPGRRGPASGMVSRAAPASAIMAAAHPKALMIAWARGANTNWPKDPPALMKPPANDRRSAGTCRAVAPIRIGKAPRAGAGRAEHPHGQHEAGPRSRPQGWRPGRRRAGTPRKRGRGRDPQRPAIGPEHGLHRTPQQLPHRQCEADGHDAQPVPVFNGDEEPGRTAGHPW